MSQATSSTSRLAPARRRARILKLASAGAAVVGFGVLSVVVRGGVQGGGGASSGAVAPGATLGVSSRISEEASQSTGSFFGSGSVTPSDSSSPPQATTHTS